MEYKRNLKRGQLITVSDNGHEYFKRVFHDYATRYEITGSVLCYADVNNTKENLNKKDTVFWKYHTKLAPKKIHENFLGKNEINI